MKHKFSTLLTLIIFISITSMQTVQAWGMTGHRVIAEIAERHLTKKAKKNIQSIIGNQKLAYWSNWADFIKSAPDPKLNQTGSWHFVNTNANLTFQQFSYELLQSSENNLYKAYLRIKDHAQNGLSSSLLEKQHDLYYIIHH